MKINLMLVGAFVLLLAGCASMSKEECLQADWYLKGVDDATQGYPLDRVVEHGKACSRVKVTPDMKAYREGHMKGARLYCVPGKGYIEGRRGASYNGICPPDLEENFLRAYRDGQDLYSIQQKIDSMHSRANGNHSQIDSDYDQIDQLKRDIVNSNSENERRDKMYRIDQLNEDIRRLDYEARHAEREAEAYEQDYHALEEKHYRMGYRK